MNETTAATTAEARELRVVVFGLLDERGRPDTLEDCLALWDELVEMGIGDIGIPEDQGGSGGTLAELSAVALALGERGISVPLVEASVGRWAAGNSARLLSVGSVVGPTGGDVTLPWGRAASAAVICTAHEARLMPVDEVVEFESLAGEPLDTISLDADAWRKAQLLAVSPARVWERAALLRAAALFGAARGAYVLTRDYVRQRRQFGGALLDIPAVAGHLATMKVELIQAQAALTRAITLVEETAAAPASGSSAVHVAVVICSSVAGQVAQLAHQLHGAIGITAEYPLHHLTRRIWAWRDLPRPSSEAARELGVAALEGGEAFIWSQLTDWCPITTGE